MSGMDSAWGPGARHDIESQTPVKTWDEALPLGNGLLGALVWGHGYPLRISLDRTDLWDARPVEAFSEPEYSFQQMRAWHGAGRHDDLRKVFEDPYNSHPAPTKIPAGRLELFAEAGNFQWTKLCLSTAEATTQFREGSARVFIHAVEPLGIITVQSAGPLRPCLVPPILGCGENDGIDVCCLEQDDSRRLGYKPAEVVSGEDWCAYVQEGACGFSFAVCLAWRQEGDTWQGCWTITTSEEAEAPLALATVRVREALTRLAALEESHRAWWREYWDQSALRVPNEILERQWYRDQFKFGCAARRGSPPVALQGPWTADDGRLPPWKGDYHHDLNTQFCYSSFYSANHLREGLSLLDWLWKTRPLCVEWTRRFYGLPGMNVPGTAGIHNQPLGGWRQYSHSATTAAWLAQHFYLYWRYSADVNFLSERAYPYLQEAAVFLESFTEARDEAGFRTLPLSSSPELYDNNPAAWFDSITNYDLSLLRWLFSATAELAREVGQLEQAQRWEGVLKELPQLALGSDDELLLAPGHPLPESHRHFSHLMAIYPLALINANDGAWGARTVQASLRHLKTLGSAGWVGFSYTWLANLEARARNGAGAESALEIFATAFTLPNSFHCNGDQSGKGYSSFTNRPFTLEANFSAAAALQEMLLQSWGGVLRIFPALPANWNDVSFENMRAEGAFLVSASKKSGRIHKVEIFAEQGGCCRVVSPFDGGLLSFDMQPGETVLLDCSQHGNALVAYSI